MRHMRNRQNNIIVRQKDRLHLKPFTVSEDIWTEMSSTRFYFLNKFRLHV